MKNISIYNILPSLVILEPLKIDVLENSSFQIRGESISFLSGDLTEKINPNTNKIVINIIVITNLSEILSIRLIYLEKFLSGVVFS